ncbi:MAG: hypothetical protein AAGI28_00870 [Pseudomonadota bacterium]
MKRVELNEEQSVSVLNEQGCASNGVTTELTNNLVGEESTLFIRRA